jgi:cytochrome c oxidase assembly protein subunit 15
LPDEDFVIEYIHRSVAATTGMLVIGTMAFTLKSKNAPRGMKIASVIAAGAVIGQITLGAIVIVERLHAVLVTAHLGLGLVLFSMVLITVLSAFRIDNKRIKTPEASSNLSPRSNKTTTTNN